MSAALLAKYKLGKGVTLNMITNTATDFVGSDGSSRSLSGALDRSLLLHLRKQADIVITDAATAARECYKPSALVNIEIWSKRGDFRDLEASHAEGDKKAFMLTSPIDLTKRLSELRTLHPRVLLETGPNVTSQLGQKGQIDSICLTVADCNDLSAAREAAAEFCKTLLLTNFHVAAIDLIDGFAFMQLHR